MRILETPGVKEVEQSDKVVPLTTGRFRVEIDGVASVGFVACRGLGASRRFFALTEGGADTPRYFVDDQESCPLRLERAYSGDAGLLEWYRSGEPRSGSVVLLASTGEEAARWSFLRGRLTRWWGPDLDSQSPGVAIEAVEIVHEGVECEM